MKTFTFIFALGIVGCAGSRETANKTRLDTTLPTSCEQQVAYATHALSLLDVSVDTTLPKNLPFGAGAFATDGVTLRVRNSGVDISRHPLSGSWTWRSKKVHDYISSLRFVDEFYPLRLAVEPNYLLAMALPWLEITNRVTPPRNLLIGLAGATPYQPHIPAKYSESLNSINNMDLEGAAMVISELMEGALAQCHQLALPLSRGASYLARENRINRAMALRIEGVPEALMACNCKADVKLVVALLFAESQLGGTTVVRTLPLPSVEIVREVSEAHPNMTMQQFIDHCMLDEGLAKRLNWHPYRDEHIRLRGLRSN